MSSIEKITELRLPYEDSSTTVRVYKNVCTLVGYIILSCLLEHLIGVIIDAIHDVITGKKKDNAVDFNKVINQDLEDIADEAKAQGQEG